MTNDEAIAEVARFNRTMRAEGFPITAEWNGGWHPLLMRAGWTRISPRDRIEDMATLRSELRKTFLNVRTLVTRLRHEKQSHETPGGTP